MEDRPQQPFKGINSRLLDFEVAWERNPAPEIELFLQDVPEQDRRRLLIELIMIDLERHWRSKVHQIEASGSTFPPRPLLEDYARAYEQLRPITDLPLGLIAEEYRVRHRWGDRPAADFYVERFGLDVAEWQTHVQEIEQQLHLNAADEEEPTDVAGGSVMMRTRCPHCHNPIAIVNDSELTEVICDSCGSSINLLGSQDTVTFKGDLRRTLGHFELIEQLGMGHFGAVWKARDTKLDRVVAVKIPRKGELDSTESATFFREARAAAQLKHSNIVRVHEVGRHEETVYIVSDYIEGATLHEWLSGQRLTMREAAELCVKLAEALHHAHEAGVVHRDLKPSNVILDLEGEPHIMDFGLAKREAGEITMTMDGQILGTPAYMSPEQAKGKGHDADRRSDVYSLGVMLFELLTGELPFRGETRMLIVQILKNDPPSPRTLDGKIPRDLETICLKCLEKEPGKRYQTAEGLAKDLQRYLKHEPIQARPVGRTEKLWRWCKRKPAVATSWAAALLLLLTLGIGGPWIALLQRQFVKEEAFLRQKAEFSQKQADENARLARTGKELAEEQLLRAEWLLYANQIASAQKGWDHGDVTAARKSLDACRWDFRNWEHDYLFTLFNMNHSTLLGHTEGVTSVAFSPDGKRIVSSSWDNSAKLWDSESGEEMLTLKGHADNVTSVAFSPDGKRIASGSWDNTAKMWDAESGEVVLTLKGHTEPINSVAFSPDGKQIVSGGGKLDRFGEVKIWDAESGEEILTLKGHTDSVNSVAFSPDGKRIVSGGNDHILKVWDADSGEEMLTLKGHNESITSVAFSLDGKQILSGSDDNTAKLWDAESGKEMFTLEGHRRFVKSVAFSPDGKRIVSGSWDRTAKLWDADSGEVVLTLKGHTKGFSCVAFSPDGKQVVSGSWDKTLKVWNADRDQETLSHRGHTKCVSSVAFSPDSQRIVSGSFDKTLKVWEGKSSEETLTLKGHNEIITSVAFSLDGKQIVSSGGKSGRSGEVIVWDAESGEVVLTLKGHNEPINSVAFSPDGKQIVSGGGKLDRFGEVKIWDAESGEEILTLKGHTDSVNSVAFSPDGKRIVSGGNDHILKVWDADSGEEMLTLKGHTKGVTSVAFSPDGERILSGSYDFTAKLWDGASGEEMLTLEGHTRSVKSVAFSPDGKRIVSGSWDKTLKVWNAESGQETLTLTIGQKGWVRSVAFSPDGKRIVSVGDDSVVRVWDASRCAPKPSE